MSRRLVGFVVAAAAVAAAALVPRTAPARSSACREASKARGSKILARDKVAVVFSRRGETFLKGCTYGGPVFKLKAICCEGEQVRLAGRFLAYTYTGTAIGDETNKLGVYDLKKGKRESIAKLDPTGEGPDPEIETGSFVEQFAVTSKGSLVWLVDAVTADQGSNGRYELRAADGTPPKERIVDSGNLVPKSLEISPDEKTILYRKDGAAMSAAIQS